MDTKKCKIGWIFGNPDSTIFVKILRWTARVWGLLAFTFALVMAIGTALNTTNPIKIRELFMLSLWLIAILGLVLAWRFERLGALITLIIMPVREALYILFYKEWTINFLLIWALVIPPGAMYLLAWSKDRKSKTGT